MKTTKFFAATMMALAFFMVACDDNETSLTSTGLDGESISLDESVDSDFSDVDEMALEGLDLEVYSNDPSGRILKRNRHRIPDCAEVTHDTEAMTITIDFGESCEGKGGKVFEGQILISYTGRRLIPGSSWTTTFNEFKIDGNQILGVHTVENISESLESNPTFYVTLSDGQVLFADGGTATREVEKTKVWIRATNPLNDEFHLLEGSTANGTNKEGVAYSTEVLEDIVVKNICKLDGIHVPVDGVKQVIKGEREYTIDFGDGECDNLATVTPKDGESQTIELERKRKG